MKKNKTSQRPKKPAQHKREIAKLRNHRESRKPADKLASCSFPAESFPQKARDGPPGVAAVGAVRSLIGKYTLGQIYLYIGHPELLRACTWLPVFCGEASIHSTCPGRVSEKRNNFCVVLVNYAHFRVPYLRESPGQAREGVFLFPALFFCFAYFPDRFV